MVISQIVSFLRDPHLVSTELGLEEAAPAQQATISKSAALLAARLEAETVSGQRSILLGFVEAVRLGDRILEITLNGSKLRAALLPADETDGLHEAGSGYGPIVLESAVAFARRGVETKLIIEGTDDQPRRDPDPALVKMVARGHHWFEQLASGSARSMREIAAAESVSERYVAQLLPLAFLAPDHVEAILDGRQPATMTAAGLLAAAPLPLRWDQQGLRAVGRYNGYG